jgi:hypothetical protein
LAVSKTTSTSLQSLTQSTPRRDRPGCKALPSTSAETGPKAAESKRSVICSFVANFFTSVKMIMIAISKVELKFLETFQNDDFLRNGDSSKSKIVY